MNEAASLPAAAPHADSLLAARNSVRLVGSLLLTWGIALAVRFLLPRSLGPERFGDLSFAEALAATFAMGMALGVDPYIRREVALRPAHASDFFGGVQLVRALLLGALAAAMAATLHAAHRPTGLVTLALLFAIAGLFVNTNATLSAMLHANQTVSEMSALAIATKVVWGGLLLASLLLGWPLWTFAFGLLASEAIESVVLYRVAQKHLGLRLRLDARATRVVLVASAPFYLGAIAQAAYARLDVSLLALQTTPAEVGYYGAAQALNGTLLLISPILAWVLQPLLSRADGRSPEEAHALLRRFSELTLAAVAPLALALMLGAGECVQLLFGPAFAPSALALRILAASMLPTYAAILAASYLIAVGRGWTPTFLIGASLALDIAGNLLFLRPLQSFIGQPGAGGAAAATALLVTELLGAAVFIGLLGRRMFDAKGLGVLAKTAALCVLVAVLDHALARLGPLRLAIDAVVYLALAIPSGALPINEQLQFVRTVRQSRS